jgi:hypothetical protein
MLEPIAILPQLWAFPIVAGFLILLGALLITVGFRSAYDGEGWFVTGWSSAFLGLLGMAIWVIMLIPFDAKYHQIYELEGTVEAVTNTIDGGDGELSYSPVVTLSGYSDPIVMDTPRITTLEGREVTLRCTLEWDPYGLDTTNCGLAAIK